MKKRFKTSLDLTPSWKEVTKIYINIIENTTSIEANEEAKKGLMFLADLLDTINSKKLLIPGCADELPTFK